MDRQAYSRVRILVVVPVVVVVVVMLSGVVLELTKVFNYRNPLFQCFREMGVK